MSLFWMISSVLLWLLVLGVAFLLLGALRALGLLRWRLEQLETITPSRLGRGAPVRRLRWHFSHRRGGLDGQGIRLGMKGRNSQRV